VLFLAPEVGGLSPRHQLEEMESAVAKVRTSSSLRFTGVFDAHVDDLFKELNTRAPDIFHFSGKQNGGDILMRTPEGGLTTIPDTALAGVFKSLDVGLKLVIIDTCFSLRCAKTIARVVPFAIGVEGSPYEDDTVIFYKVFYQGLAAGRSLRHAVGQAQTALKFARVESRCIPQVCCSDAYDPADTYFVTSRQAAKRKSAGGRT
jgi:hypothetical protein